MSEFCDVGKLSLEVYSEIFQAASRDLKREILLNALEIETIDEESELRKSIVVDFCLDAISFASDQGFSWENVDRTLKFGLKLLNETTFEGHEVDEALNIFKQNISKEISTFPDVELKALIDYFLSTFFRHYQLYLYCMTKEQELDQRASDVEIDAPIVVDELAKGTDIDKWHYQQTMKKIEDEKDSLQMKRFETLKAKINLLDGEKQEALMDLDKAHEEKNTEELPNILERLTKLHVDFMESEIQKSLEDSKEIIEFTMKRGAVTNPDSSKLRPVSRNRPKSKQKK